ncbi:MAG: hypothetical protein GXO47_10085 [Chlorobi bacterium]|nr:hypothetical protein [Chlorobiota bacterium]
MENNKLKAALLPLYLELYDDFFPELRLKINKFRDEIAELLKSEGIELTELPISRTKNEFDRAVDFAEKEQVHALITLHLAYSPSLKSIEALTKTNIPIIVLDTTPTYAFSSKQNSEEIMYNHGIHGVQDMCNMLIRKKKHFVIEAGHYIHSDVLNRVIDHVKAAKIYQSMKNSRVGIIGEPFDGMGDFFVDSETLSSTLGITVVKEKKKITEMLLDSISSVEIDNEIEKDNRNYINNNITPEQHRISVKSGLALRQWIKTEKLTAFTINFLNIMDDKGLSVMPFLEISKLMGNNIGYAGEGDTLTASLIGALFSIYDEVTFTEMFCPDWEGNTIFMSHMGELNPKLTQSKPVMRALPWKFSPTPDTILLTGCYKAGNALLVNLAPVDDEIFTLIIAPVTVLPENKDSNFDRSVRGWIKPQLSVKEFLEAYSNSGGTHHSALIYNGDLKVIAEFGKMMGWKVLVLDKNSSK